MVIRKYEEKDREQVIYICLNDMFGKYEQSLIDYVEWMFCRYYIEVADINPQDLDNAVAVKVNNALTVVYSPMNYIVNMYKKGSESLQALVKTLYNYHLAAEAYLAA